MNTPDTDVETVVIGAGLCGLATALLLIEAGRPVRVVEARDIPGGRIRSVFDDKSGDTLADLGPTWIWPSFQPVVARWVEKLELTLFPQFESGNAVLDYGPGSDPEIRFLPGQMGNMRVAGGLQAMIDRLVAMLPKDVLLTNTPVRTVTVEGSSVTLEFSNDECPHLHCERLIVAVPPRVAAETIDWMPELPAALTRALEATPTWMAPHAKVVALYEKPFWREKGLSGRIASQSGPIVEGHDHCGADGSPAALFGFIGWPHDMRVEAGSDLKQHVQAQLLRCFGPGSPDPLSIHIEDWASDLLVARPPDLTGPGAHPEVGPEILREPHIDGRVWFAGSETARQSPGLVEGAFDAAEQTVAAIMRTDSAVSAVTA